MVQVLVDVPEGALASLGEDAAGFAREMRLAAAMKWFELRRVSQERAAEIAGLSSAEFIDALRRLGVSPSQETADAPGDEEHRPVRPLVGDGASRACIERNDRLLSTVLDNVPVSLWEIDRNGIVTFQDGKALAAIGLERHQFVGKNIFDFYTDTVDLRRALAGEKVHGKRNDAGRDWENWFLPVHDGNGVGWVIGLSLDVTEQKHAEDELRAKIELIERQRHVIRELSVPIIQVWDRVLALPLTGAFDSGRADDITEELLAAVEKAQPRFVILDLTGIDVVDTTTANRLIAIIRALELLGFTGIVTGIRAGVAQAIVGLGIDLVHIRTFGLLRDGLRFCMRHLTAPGPG
ncbi:UPF0175 family protein [Polyangium aurulentum]|uniref:UPF0175 family protein n=1 Tax=Polyangium aurulentum TaxID=2567896 RepID=UPI0010ADF686|nr:UPF0175 family protein [Polyangium aurulentum]UQA63113.1 UPF0175 family protein [Polyangium aurulentum]